MNVHVRPYDRQRPDEEAIIYSIFYEAVRIGARVHYSQAQREAWAPHRDIPKGWADKLGQMHTWVGEVDGELAGFMAVCDDIKTVGYIDLAFVRPRWMGRSVARALYGSVVDWSQTQGLTRLTTHASHLGRPFFARFDWRVDYPETVERDDEMLEHFAMSLDLRGPNETSNQS